MTSSRHARFPRPAKMKIRRAVPTLVGAAAPAPAVYALAGSLALALLVVPGAGALAAQEGDVPEAMERMKGFDGSWEADRVEFLDADGDVARVSSAEAHNEVAFDGHLLIHRGHLAEPRIETRGWYFWNPRDERIHLGSVSSSGRYDEFVGGWEGDRLVMVLLPGPAYGERRFRMIHDRIRASSYRETLEVSEDGGASWRVSHRQVMRRIGEREGDPREILDAMDPYTGHWRSEARAGSGGDRYHHEYDLEWIDPARTIARVHITRVGSDGETRTVFEGFKGREPDGTGVYYHGASPSGRGARGEVVLEGRNLVTIYDGWTAEGETVRIRDVFRPVEDGTFRSRTLLRPSADADWREIGSERWTRVGRSR